MSIVPVNVPEPFQEKPIDYAAYGDRIAATIREGGNQIGAIMEGAKMVSDKMDKDKLKAGMLQELQADAPHVLKYMKPNPSFEDVARGSYQMDVIRGAWEKAKLATPKGKDGKALTTLGGRENFEQLAFAATPEQFQKILDNLQKYVQEADQAKGVRTDIEALRTGAGAEGTRETKAQEAIEAGFEGRAPKQAVDMFKMAGVPEALYSKERIAKAKADARAALEKAKADARALKEQNINKHRAAMRNIQRGRAGQSETDIITKIQRTVDDQEADLRQANQAKGHAQKALAKAKNDKSVHQGKMSNYKAQIKMLEDDGDDETAGIIQKKLDAAKQAYMDALNTIDEQQDLVTEAEAIIDQIEAHKRDYKRAISESTPQIAVKFKWAEGDTAQVPVDQPTGADPAAATPRPVSNPAPAPSPIPQETPREKAKKFYDAKFGTGMFDRQDPTMQQRIVDRVLGKN